MTAFCGPPIRNPWSDRGASLFFSAWVWVAAKLMFSTTYIAHSTATRALLSIALNGQPCSMQPCAASQLAYTHMGLCSNATDGEEQQTEIICSCPQRHLRYNSSNTISIQQCLVHAAVVDLSTPLLAALYPVSRTPKLLEGRLDTKVDDMHVKLEFAEKKRCGKAPCGDDSDDAAKRLRTHSSHVANQEDREIGQKYFENWWWTLDRHIVERSNILRAGRGVARLRSSER